MDVGAGAGFYGRNLRFTQFDAIEIYEPYFKRFHLESIYNKVYLGNILEFDWSNYDYLILGDVLEHIELAQGQKLISDIKEKNIKCLVAVPYNSKQGTWEGNVYETHLQEDLTIENMIERYPSLRLLIGDNAYGYYVNY